jgi:hypothetical protein
MTSKTPKINSRLSSFNSEKLSFRLPKWQKDIVDFVSEKEKINPTDVIRRSINNYFLYASTSSTGELRQKTKERYVQMELFDWAERNQKKMTVEDSPSIEDIKNSTVVSVEEITLTPSNERDPFLDFYYAKQ